MAKTKRSIDSNMEAKEPLNKVAKTEKNILNTGNISPQNMKKPDLLKYCLELEEIINKLQTENRTLVKEKEEGIDAMKGLEESVKILNMKNKALQQEEKFTYDCTDCDYESDCVHCFSDHDHDQHDEDEEETDVPNFHCYYCDETFSSKMNVMNHTKLYHVAQAKHCINFLEGTCRYDDRCWFLHDEKVKQSNPKFNCNYCDSSFRLKSQLMLHKKIIHIDKVSKCSNEDKCCKFGSDKCWFIHKENIEQAYESAKIVNQCSDMKHNNSDT